MATLIPSLNSSLPKMTGGEKRLAHRLEAKLEEDYLLWYEVSLGTSGYHPDFILFHPVRGLWTKAGQPSWPTARSRRHAIPRVLTNSRRLE
jgi:hypothetical protein